MRRLSAPVVVMLLMSVDTLKIKPEPARLCVSTSRQLTEYRRHHAGSATNSLKRSPEQNKGKDVTKGRPARIETILLESDTETKSACARRTASSFCTRTWLK